ncbi:hypothetical protein G6F46_014460 [Rhizopus delemar]|nr:hypothetical protein G6F46_014460 [Rhizopus delemar]
MTGRPRRRTARFPAIGCGILPPSIRSWGEAGETNTACGRDNGTGVAGARRTGASCPARLSLPQQSRAVGRGEAQRRRRPARHRARGQRTRAAAGQLRRRGSRPDGIRGHRPRRLP